MVVVVGPGASAPYSKSPTILGPPGVFPQLAVADHPLSHSNTELTLMPTTSKEKKSSEGANEQPSLVDVDYQMDDLDGIDNDTDSFGSDFGDPPEYLDPSVEQEPEVSPKLTTPFSTHGGLGSPQDGSDNTIQPSSPTRTLSPNNCIVCHCPKSFKDVATCGNRLCDQQLKDWQGLSRSPRPTSTSASSSNRCPVCNNSKRSGDTICGNEVCAQRLKFWKGFPNDLSSSSTSIGRPGSSSYSSAAQTRSQTRAGGMCEVCHQRPRYSHNGKTFPTCGLTCAAKLNPSGRVEMCDLCHQRPKVVLNGRVFPHCGRTCRDKAKAAETNNGIGMGTCTTCLNCWKAPANVRKDEFCSDSCRETIEHRAPLLLEVPRGHASFNEVENEFKSAWTHRKAPCPSVKKIYMVCVPAKHDANFEDYGKKVSSTYGIPGSFLIGKKKEEFRWISGLRDCPLGHPGMTTPCQHHQCQLCHILRGIYVPDIFGNGISTTSLARATHNYDRWAANINPKFKISKVVLLSKVYLGKVAELDSFQARSGPPHGANSVNIVNYVHHSRVETDEILVYTCEALRPVYLISYE